MSTAQNLWRDWRRFSRRSRGNVGVEFAIVSLLLVAILAGAVQCCGFVIETAAMERGATGIARVAASIPDGGIADTEAALAAALARTIGRDAAGFSARILRVRMEQDPETGGWVPAAPEILSLGSLDTGLPSVLCSSSCADAGDALLPETYLLEGPGGTQAAEGWRLTAVELAWRSGTLGSEVLFGDSIRSTVRWIDNGIP